MAPFCFQSAHIHCTPIASDSFVRGHDGIEIDTVRIPLR